MKTFLNLPTSEPEPKCGVYWIIATCLTATAIAIGIGFGGLLWLVLS